MPPLLCPRCKSTNPEAASFCYNDGEALRGGQAASAAHKLANEFVFPSGRRCNSFDELAAGCQEEWAAARDLLKKGVFQKYFATAGRQDLAKAAADAMRQADPNIGLTGFLGSLPVSRTTGPRLDLNPRRLHLGGVLAGETRQVDMTVSNQGEGMLHGTLTVAEGGAWIRVAGAGNGQCELNTEREQKVSLQVDTRGLPSGQTYGGKLTVVTNGGVVEVPVRLDLAAHPFPKAPFQGARAPRELAEKMKNQPKQAVPMLESGEVAKWFAANGWNYPVRAPVRGVAGVQQFFEALGLSKPPTVQLSQTEFRARCTFPTPTRGEVVLQTATKKWVYANVESDVPWLKVLTPQVAGPQKATIAFEIDTKLAPRGKVADATLTVSANGGQNLVLRVRAQVAGGEVSLVGRLLRPTISGAVALLLLRLLLAPLADGYARNVAAYSAAVKTMGEARADASPFASYGGWLASEDLKALGMSWPGILFGSTEPEGAFRDAFVSSFVRIMVIGLAWVGAVGGAWVLMRRGGGVFSVPWGVVAGGVAGVAGAATLGALLLAGDVVPHALWSALDLGGGAGMVPVWILLAVLCWTALGAGIGAALGAIGPLGWSILAPAQAAVAGFLRLLGMRRFAAYFTAT